MLQGVPVDRLYESVYEQWLVGDLAMLEEPVLEKVIRSGTQFTGSHALQVDIFISWDHLSMILY